MDLYIKLLNHLRLKIGELSELLSAISDSEQELKEKLEFISEELIHISDHTKHEIEDLSPCAINRSVEYNITQALYDRAFEECLNNQDFSLRFIQKSFHLDYMTAVKLRDQFVKKKKIKVAYIANDVVCKG